MRIVCLVLFIAGYLFLCFNASDIQEVRVTKTDIFTKDKKVYTVLGFKRLNIIFDGFDVKFLKCTVNDASTVFLPGKHTFVTYNRTAVLKTPGIKGNLTIRFDCALISTDTSVINIPFYVKTSTANKIFVVVDGTPLEFKVPKTIAPDYDGIIEYSCDKGETVDLICSKFYDDGRLRLRYYDLNHTKMVESDEMQSKDPINFRLLMRAENNRSYVDCTHVTGEGNNRKEYSYRVIFILRDNSSNNNDIIITVNDMELISRPRKETVLDTYHYKFIYSEELTITCEPKDKGIFSGIVTTIYPIYPDSEMEHLMERLGAEIKLTDIEKTLLIYRFLVDTKYLDKALLKFFMYDSYKEDYLERDVKFYIDDNGVLGPAVLGLSPSNILYQYNTSTTEWIIHYQYMVHQVLKLTCVMKGNISLQWIYGEKIASPVLVNTSYGTSYIKYDFYMDAESHETITCESMRSDAETQRITIVLHLIPDLQSPENYLKIDGATEIHENNMGGQLTLLEIIGIIAGILLITVVCAIYWWRSKRNAQVTKVKQRCSSIQDHHQVHELTDQRQSHEYAYIEYDDITHRDALAANQGSGSSVKAPAPPPRVALPSKSTRSQMLPLPVSRHNEMEQCRCAKKDDNLIPSTNQRKDLDDTSIENEYDYVYGRRKKSPCVAKSH